MSKLTPMQAARPVAYLRNPEPRVGEVGAEEDGWITFADLLRTLKIHWKGIVTAGALSALAGLTVACLMPRIYAGTALVMIESRQNRIFNDQTDPSVLSNLPSDPSSVESQVQMIKSHQLTGQVVDRLHLADDPEFNGTRRDLFSRIQGGIDGALSGLGQLFGAQSRPDVRGMPGLNPAQQRRERTIAKVMGNLDVQIVGRSTIIDVTFRSHSPDKAAGIANAMAASYVGGLSDAKVVASEDAAKWLSDRVTQLGKQAGAADAAVQQYKAEHGLLDTSTGAALSDQKLGDLTTQLIAAEGDRAEAQAKLSRVKQLVQSGNHAEVTEVVDSPLIGQLREQEATLLQQKADFASRYGDRNPKMLSLETQLNVLKQKIDEEAGRIVGTVSNTVAVADAHVQSIRGEMAGATSAANTQNYARVKLGGLQADAASAHALYQTYLDRLKQTQQQTSLKSTDARVASPAPVPLAPVSPKTALMVGGGALGGLGIGLLFALLAEQFCAGFRSVQELERITGLPVLATLPELDTGRSLQDVAKEVIRKPRSEYSEGVRALEVSLSRSPTPSGDPKVFVVVSALPSEGKTVTAINLARRFAIDGKRVVLVDGDFRRPSVGAALDAHMVRFDLGDYLARRCLLDEAIYGDPDSPLVALLVSHAGSARNEDYLPAMAELIRHLRAISDIVIIDTPPVLAVQDAKMLAEMSDGALFAVRWAKTSREAVLRAIKLLRDFGVPLLGTSLVRAHPKYHRYYSYGYQGLPTLARYYEG